MASARSPHIPSSSTVTDDMVVYKFTGPNDDGYGRLFSKASTAFASGNSCVYVPATTNGAPF